VPTALPPLLDAFHRHRLEVQGVAESTVRCDLKIVQQLVEFLRRRDRTTVTIRVADIDEFLSLCSCHMVPKTLARVATALRTYLGFLYMTGRVRRNLAMVVASPRVVRGDTPPRALAWPDVRRILRAINRKNRNGLRDYALLLTMAAYGLGAGEARGLTIESVDWRRRELHVVRPKTGRAVNLPLLPGVAKALAAYLRRGRPRHCTTRALFVRLHAPYAGLGSSGAIRHVLQKHAKAAGVSAAFLGSHVLRHSHACRQIDLGQSATVVGDILGHRRPESTSAYVRVALTRLRRMALPVPI
jgi:integrase/recombinase XerD